MQPFTLLCHTSTNVKEYDGIVVMFRRNRNYSWAPALTASSSSSTDGGAPTEHPWESRSNSQLDAIPRGFQGSDAASITSSRIPRPEHVKGVADPLGLQVAMIPSEIRGDIVFVHGLNGSAWKTWSYDGDDDSFWPQWLAEDEDLAQYRVSTFGFDSKVKGAASNLDIIDFAKDLLFQLLTTLQTKSCHKNNPIIFVAHSMGGLVVKKAIMLGKGDRQYKDVISRVQGVVFLATPHRGSQYAKTLNKVLSIAPLGAAPKSYVSGLDSQSSALQDINESFRQYSEDLFLCSFYETLRTSIGIKDDIIVEKESAVLGYPGELSTAVNANHKSICKYYSRADPNFHKVRGVLKQWALRIHSRGMQQLLKMDDKCTDGILAASPTTPTLDRRASLRPTEHVEGKIRHIFGLETALESLSDSSVDFTCQSTTGQWLFSKPEFQQWAESDGDPASPQTFFLIGPPGVGKSTLAQSVTDFIRSRDECVIHHSFTKSHQLKQTGSFGVRSIAAQLAMCHLEFQEAILQLHEKSGVRFQQTQSFKYLWEHVFENILFKIPITTPIYLVLDSLDESDSTSQLLQKLSEVAVTSPIRIFASSRPVKGVPSSGKHGTVVHNLSPDDTKGDMIGFVNQTVEQTLPDDELTQRFVQAEILKRAEGSFLWAKLALEVLQDSWHTKDDIMIALTKVPSGMTAMYNHLITLVEAQGPRNLARARDILSWVALSWRPLYITELQEALMSTHGTFTNLALTITQLCGHFVSIDSSDEAGPKALLIHTTAKDFLTSTKDDAIPWIDSKLTHKTVAQTCLQYLCADWRARFSSLDGLSQIARPVGNVPQNNKLLALGARYPLLAYTIWHWSYHLRKSTNEDPDLLEALERFLVGHSLMWIEAIAMSGDMSQVVRSARYLKAYVKKTSTNSSSNTRWVQPWAVDFIRITSKFAENIIVSPSSVYRNIPPMCPRQSMIGRAFGMRGPDSLDVRGHVMESWDDCVASVVIENDEYVAHLAASEGLFVTLGGFSPEVTVWRAETCERVHNLHHGELVREIAINKSGTLIGSASLRKFHLWDGASGELIQQVAIPNKERVQHLLFAPGDCKLLAAYESFKIEHIDIESGELACQELDVSGLDAGYQNCPFCQTISPDGTKVAMGWRGRPPLVWDIRETNASLPLKCRSSTRSASIMTTKQLVWHPDSSKIFIVCPDTTVYEWNLFDDELYELPHIKARHLAVSSDGSLLLTADHEGGMHVWTYPRLSLIYCLRKSGDLINAIAFAPDGQRFYDIRNGFSCNIWEPESLIASDDPDSGDSGSAVGSQPSTEPVISTQSNAELSITAISAGPTDDVYACAREGGAVFLYSALDCSKIRKLYQHSDEQKATVLSWSCKGKYIASCDISSHVIVKRLANKADGKWAVFPVLDFRLGDASPELVFSPDERFLLIYTTGSLGVWDLKAKTKLYSKMREQGADWHWVAGIDKSSNLYRVESDGRATAFDWATGEPVPLPLQPVFETLDINPIMPGASVDGTIVWSAPVHDSSHLLIATVDDRHGRWASYYKNLRLAVVNLTQPQEAVQYLSDNICSKVKLLLGTRKNELLFLCFDGWVCSYSIALTSSVADRRQSTGVMARKEDVEGFTRHFYVPRDWLNTTSAHPIANSDGTVFFPKQGSVAIVRNGLR